MKLLIFGASGKTGQHLVNQALSQGHDVTAFARTPAKITAEHKNLTILQGDVTDMDKVRSAVQGKDVVLCTLGAASPFKFDQSIVDGVQNIIVAMEANDVKRFIYLSFIGVKETRDHAGFVIKNIAPRLLRTEIRGHEVRERMIQGSRLKWTIVRAPTLTNGIRLGKYRSGEDIRSGGIMVSISRADVADFMLTQLIDESFLNKVALVLN